MWASSCIWSRICVNFRISVKLSTHLSCLRNGKLILKDTEVIYSVVFSKSAVLCWGKKLCPWALLRSHTGYMQTVSWVWVDVHSQSVFHSDGACSVLWNSSCQRFRALNMKLSDESPQQFQIDIQTTICTVNINSGSAPMPNERGEISDLMSLCLF